MIADYSSEIKTAIFLFVLELQGDESRSLSSSHQNFMNFTWLGYLHAGYSKLQQHIECGDVT